MLKNYDLTEITTKTEKLAVVNLLNRRSLELNQKRILMWSYPLPTDFFLEKMQNSRVLVLKKSEKIIAVTFVSNILPPDVLNSTDLNSQEKCWYLHKLATDTDQKGTGLGSNFLEMIEEKAKAESVDLIVLDCISEPPFLIDFYKKHNYELIGEYQDFGKLSKNTYEMAIFQKKLNLNLQ